jgi:hypothetical protein
VLRVTVHLDALDATLAAHGQCCRRPSQRVLAAKSDLLTHQDTLCQCHVQDVRFDRDGQVSFSEWAWFTPYHHEHADPAPDNISSDASAAPTGAGAERWGQVSDDDEIVTINLPLLGVLKAVDAKAGMFRRLAELAVKRFFYERRDDGVFEGLFMRRCALCRHCLHACIRTLRLLCPSLTELAALQASQCLLPASMRAHHVHVSLLLSSLALLACAW